MKRDPLFGAPHARSLSQELRFMQDALKRAALFQVDAAEVIESLVSMDASIKSMMTKKYDIANDEEALLELFSDSPTTGAKQHQNFVIERISDIPSILHECKVAAEFSSKKIEAHSLFTLHEIISSWEESVFSLFSDPLLVKMRNELPLTAIFPEVGACESFVKCKSHNDKLFILKCEEELSESWIPDHSTHESLKSEKTKEQTFTEAILAMTETRQEAPIQQQLVRLLKDTEAEVAPGKREIVRRVLQMLKAGSSKRLLEAYLMYFNEWKLLTHVVAESQTFAMINEDQLCKDESLRRVAAELTLKHRIELIERPFETISIILGKTLGIVVMMDLNSEKTGLLVKWLATQGCLKFRFVYVCVLLPAASLETLICAAARLENDLPTSVRVFQTIEALAAFIRFIAITQCELAQTQRPVGMRRSHDPEWNDFPQEAFLREMPEMNAMRAFQQIRPGSFHDQDSPILRRSPVRQYLAQPVGFML